jgi:hypothetical protein
MKRYKFLGIFSNFSWKKMLIFLPAPLLAQIEHVIYPLIGLLLVIGLDLFTALISHFYNKRKEQKTRLSLNDYRYGILSGGLRQTIKKSYQYGMAAIVMFIIEIFGFGGAVQFTVPLVNLEATLTQFLLWCFIMIEFKSIDENLKGVSGKSAIESIANIFTYFRGIFTSIRGPQASIDTEWAEEEEGDCPQKH